MSNTFLRLKTPLEKILEAATLASKVAIILGAVCITIYAQHINYFPQDLSMGNGLLLCFIFACFGIIYSVLTGCLLSLGILFSPIINVLLNGIIHIDRSLRKNKEKYQEPVFKHYKTPRIVLAALLSISGMMLIYALSRHDVQAYWQLPMLSIFLYMAYSIYNQKTTNNKDVINSVLHTDEKEKLLLTHTEELKRKRQALLVLCLSPLVFIFFFTQLWTPLLDATMRFAHIRVEHPIVYMKEPYSSLLPQTLASKNQMALKDYVAFDGLTILFKGFGKTTVVSFPDTDAVRQLEIPNDFLIIEKRKPHQSTQP
jgi:hypothetical protein